MAKAAFNRKKIPVINVVLEKNGEDQLDQLCEKWSITWSQKGEEYPTYIARKEG